MTQFRPWPSRFPTARPPPRSSGGPQCHLHSRRSRHQQAWPGPGSQLPPATWCLETAAVQQAGLDFGPPAARPPRLAPATLADSLGLHCVAGVCQPHRRTADLSAPTPPVATSLLPQVARASRVRPGRLCGNPASRNSDHRLRPARAKRQPANSRKRLVAVADRRTDHVARATRPVRLSPPPDHRRGRLAVPNVTCTAADVRHITASWPWCA